MEVDVEGTVRSLVQEKTLTITGFLESLRSKLLSESADDREAALTEVISVVTRLPRSCLTEEQVGLLLEFLLGRLESSALAGGDVLEGIRHLILFSDNRPENLAIPVFQTLFRDGNVQAWPQKDRMKQYEVLQWLLKNQKQQLMPLGTDVVMSFIRAVEGERDPRCLLIVFRMFNIVASSFSLSPLSEDMFEVVACYYPVEFKPLPGDVSITKDMLASACRATLTAHSSFAPFCYMLIEEKFEDDETTHEQKEELCRLITAAATLFPPGSLLPHLSPILGGIRSMAVDPNRKGPLSPEVGPALRAIAQAVEKCGLDKIKSLADNMLENMEPFVLQAEMGLSARALALLQSLAEAAGSISGVVMDKALVWIISLIQGTTVNTAANRADICREGLQFVVEWVRLIRGSGNADVLARYESTLLTSLDEARESLPSEAKMTMYHCLKEYLLAGSASDDVISRCNQLISAGLESIESPEERDCFLSLVSIHASTRWEDHDRLLTPNKASESEKFFSVLCASVVHEASWTKLGETVEQGLSEALSKTRLDDVVAMCQRCKSMTSLVDKVVTRLVDVILRSTSDDQMDSDDVIAISLQSLGLLVSASVHSQLVGHMLTADREICRMLAAQTQEISLLQPALTSTKSQESRLLYTFSYVNRTSSIADVPESVQREEWFDEIAAKALLLCGSADGVQRIEKLFSSYAAGASPSTASRIFDFSTPEFDPARGNYRTTALWRQRLFCQTVPHYIKSVVEAENKSSLLSLLPSILSFAEQTGQSVEGQLAKFLPVFVAALTLPLASVSGCVFSALPSFLTGIQTEQLDQLSVAIITKRLADAVRHPGTSLPTTLAALQSLEQLAKKASPTATQPLIQCVAGAATQCLAHKKRVVRQRAAGVKNTWDVLALK